MQKKKRMLIGICGSIGAISIIKYIEILFQHYEIELILTENAKHFLQYKGLSAITKKCYVEEFDNLEPLHINLANNVDEFLLLPASANTISKMAHGIGDNLLTSTLLAYDKPVYIAANMNPKMWNNQIIQDNVKYLQSKGHVFINEGNWAIEVSTGKEVYSGACMPSIEKLMEILKIVT